MKTNVKRFISAVMALACAGSCMTMNISAEEKTIVYGDGNCDGFVDIRDVTTVNQHLIKSIEMTEQGIKNCDFFGDGEVSVSTLGQIKKFVVRIIDKLEPVQATPDSDVSAANVFVSDIHEGICVETDTVTISDAQELYNYLLDYYMSYGETGVVYPLIDDITKYDETFFEDNVLVIKAVGFPMNDGMYKIDSITPKTVTKDSNGNFVVDFEVYQTVGINSDEGRFVGIEIPKSEYDAQTVSFNFNNVYEGIVTDYTNVFKTSLAGQGINNKQGSLEITSVDALYSYITASYSSCDGYCDVAPVDASYFFPQYDEEFFKENVLLISTCDYPSYPSNPTVKTLTLQGDVLTAEVEYEGFSSIDELTTGFVAVEIPKISPLSEEYIKLECKSVDKLKLETFNASVSEMEVYSVEESVGSRKVTTLDELYTYLIDSMGIMYDIEEGYDGDLIPADVVNMFPQYDEEYFKENALLINSCEFSNPTVSAEVNSVTVEDSVFKVDVQGNFGDEYMCDVITYRYVAVEIPNTSSYNKIKISLECNFFSDYQDEQGEAFKTFVSEEFHDYDDYSTSNESFLIANREELEDYVYQCALHIHAILTTGECVESSNYDELIPMFDAYDDAYFENNKLLVRLCKFDETGVYYGDDGFATNDVSLKISSVENNVFNVDVNVTCDRTVSYTDTARFIALEIPETSQYYNCTSANVSMEYKICESAHTDELTCFMTEYDPCYNESNMGATTITTVEELEYYLDSVYGEDESLMPPNLLSQYDEEYFETKYILIKREYTYPEISKFDCTIDENGNYVIALNESNEASSVKKGFFVGVEAYKSDYKGQTMTVKRVNQSVQPAYNYDFEITDMSAYATADEPVVCTEYSQFCDYLNKNYVGDYDYYPMIMDKYNAEFFENNVVFMVSLSTNNGQMTPNFDYIDVKDNEVILGIVNDYSTADVEDLNTCLASFSMSKELYNNQKFSVSTRDTDEIKDFEFVAVRTNGTLDIEGYEPTYYGCIRSVEDLPQTTGFERYDEEFFKENYLYLAGVAFGSGSYYPQGKSITYDEDHNYILNMYQTYNFEQDMTCDIGYWYVGFSVPIEQAERRNPLVYVNFEEAPTSSAVYEPLYTESKIEFVTPDLIDTDVKNFSGNDIYNAGIIRTYEEFKAMLTPYSNALEREQLLEKYNEEFFETNAISVAKWVDCANVDIYDDVVWYTNEYGYDFIRVGIAHYDATPETTSYDEKKEYCAIVSFDKKYCESEDGSYVNFQMNWLE